MSTLTLLIPPFVQHICDARGDRFATDEARMALAVDLAARNVAEGGSPFGAAIFAGEALVAAGVNCVLTSGFSIAHAEIVAMMHAQHVLRDRPIPDSGLTLVTSAEPCCQCFSALIWSGIDHLVCGARREDVERIGFDEGPKPEPWVQVLKERGIQVREDVLREQAVETLNAYQSRGGPIYGLRPKGNLP